MVGIFLFTLVRITDVACQTPIQQIPPRRGFPINHLSHAIGAGAFFELEGFVEFFPCDTACRADRLVNRAGFGDFDGEGLDRGCEFGGIVQGFARGGFENEGGFGGVHTERFAQVIAKRVFAAWFV